MENEHHIDLIPSVYLFNSVPYRSNSGKNKESEKQVQKLLENDWVQASLSPCVMSLILVLKKYGTWCMCTNYHTINNIIIKYIHLIPSIDDLLNELHGAYVFFKNDLKSGYRQIRIREGDEWKKDFKTKFGLYIWLFMSFGLKNAHSNFMILMNHVLIHFMKNAHSGCLF